MASTGTNKSRAWVGIGLAIVLLLAIYFVYRNSQDATVVRSATVERQNLISTLSTNGKVEPMSDFQAHAPAPSIVDKVFVSVGDHVVKGQQLVRLESTDAQSKVSAAQAAVASAQASLSNMRAGGTSEELTLNRNDLAVATQQQQQAATSLNTIEALFAKGSASQAEVQQARNHLEETSARVAQLKSHSTSRYSATDIHAQQANLSQAQASLAAANAGYNGVNIRAPFAGEVYSLPIAPTDFVQGGEALLDVADLSRLQVRAYFDEPEIGKLAAGQPVKIVWDAKPNRTWQGHITQAPTTVISYGTRNVGECIITVDNPDGELLPNTNVTVTVTTLERHMVLSLPREALHTEGLKNYVYRIVNNRLVRTEVQVGVVNLTRVEITSGLNESDRIALGATTEADFADGMRVKIKP
jgi:HlyD family secretion protein